MRFISTWAWAGAVLFGAMLVVAGIYMVFEGRNAHDDVRDALTDERIITGENADIALQPVDGPAEAKAQADLIREDVLKITGGKTYAEMERDDPNRAVYVQSITLRTALMQSYMAFKVSDLVSGVGAVVAALGLGQIALGLYLGMVVVRRPAPSLQAAVDPEAARKTYVPN